MELISTPHRPVRRRRHTVAVGLGVVVLLAVTALVLAPLALGLHHVVIRDGGLGSSWRGALAIEEVKPGRDLGVGNVITFVPPGATDGREVTRRVVSIRQGVAWTSRGSNAPADPWQLRLDESSYARVIVRAPYVARVVTDAWVQVTAVVVVLAGISLPLLGRRRRRARGSVTRMARPADAI